MRRKPPRRNIMVRAAALNPADETSAMRQLTALIFAAFLGAAPAGAAPDAVDIEGTKLKGLIYRPQGNGPFPAVVAMHGCDGLPEQGSVISRRYADWGERLMGAGYVVLFPDSFAARGLGAQCSAGQRSLRSGRERVVDVEAARRFLQAQTYVAADRVSLIGWANGGGRGAVDRAPRRGAQGRQAGFPLRGRVLSGLPPAARHRLGDAPADPDPDRRQGRLDARGPVRADGRRSARPHRARHASTSIPAPTTTSTIRTCRCSSASTSRSRPGRSAACMSAPTRRRARMRSSACRSGSRADRADLAEPVHFGHANSPFSDDCTRRRNMRLNPLGF